MHKRYFWPLTIVLFGLVFLGTNVQIFPTQLLWLWPIVMLVVGLGALLIADRDEWLTSENSASGSSAAKKTSVKKTTAKKTTKRTARR